MPLFEKFVFRPYDPSYPELFQLEKEKLVAVLGEGVAVEHIGSTAVEGLGGKGIIDIMIGMESELKEILPVLCSAGYVFKEHASSEERLFLQKDYTENGKSRRVHIHVVEKGKKEWDAAREFRNKLRQEPELRKKYGEMKKRAVEECKGNKEIYRKIKDRFFKCLQT